MKRRTIRLAAHCGKPVAALALALAMAMAAAAEAQTPLPPKKPVALEAAGMAIDGAAEEAVRLAARAGDPLLQAWVAWRAAIADGAGPDWATLQPFLKDSEDWPRQALLRQRAEAAMPPDLPPAAVVAFFGDKLPATAGGALRLTDSLIALHRSEAAAEKLGDFWAATDLPRHEEQAMLARNGKRLTAYDHARRLDRQIWQGNLGAARRTLALVDAGARALAEARMALAENKKGVDGLVARVPAVLRADPGLVYERLRWRRRGGNTRGAQELLLAQPRDPAHADLWWKERRIIAGRLLAEGDAEGAYALSHDHGQPAGSAGWADAEWYAGWIALSWLKRPEVAFGHFDRMFGGVATPISQSRAAWWAGRAARAQGRADVARHWFGQAAQHPQTFYGQMALGELGMALTLPGNDPRPDANRAAAFNRRLAVRMARMLAELGLAKEARPFIEKLGLGAASALDYAEVARLAREIGQTHLSVALARQAMQKGFVLTEAAYPVLKDLPPTMADPALLHAVIRQESSFDPAATSSAGALGLMQLMPGTARQVAASANLEHWAALLTQRPSHNITLGATYLESLRGKFGGSTVLALCAYNAGPQRAAEWLQQLGDPRDPAIDPVDWIESIPFPETRNYVQRVMENWMVYRVRLGAPAAPPELEREIAR